MTESVDTLLHISDKENIVPGKAPYDGILNPTVILILIDIYFVKKISVIRGNLRIFKKRKCDLLLIRKIHSVFLTFLLSEDPLRSKNNFEIPLIDRVHLLLFRSDFLEGFSEEISRLIFQRIGKCFRLFYTGDDVGKLVDVTGQRIEFHK